MPNPLASGLLAALIALASWPALGQDTSREVDDPTFRTVPVETVPAEVDAEPETASEAARSGPLRVGVVPRPPYAIQSEIGWTGLAIDGWQLAAARAGLAFELVALEPGTGVDAVAAGTVDLALPLDATAEAASRVAFTAPLHTATLGVAGGPSTGPLDVVGRLLTWDLARIVIGLSLLLLVVGAIMWLIERRRNAQMFGGSTAEGLGDGFWWAGVTLTTIGYGDKAPITTAGRAVAMLWMLAGLAISSALTAAVVSATGIGNSDISLPEDLRGLQVLAEADTAASRFLEGAEIGFTEVAEVDVALRAVEAGEADAFVGLAPMIAERVKALDLDVPVKRSEREPHLVAIALPRDAEYGPAVEAAVIATVTAPAWGDLVARYLER